MLKKNTHIHFVGIGGIGMSGIAKILAQQGYRISGCDTNLQQKSVLDLQTLGCAIYPGNDHALCDDTSISTLVYTSDVSNAPQGLQHPEIVRAQQRGIPTIARGVMLAELTRTKYTLAVAGSHGKTTTTSLLAHIFMEAHVDPTVVIGGHLHRISSNAQYGSSDFLITETDESDRSLLHLYPTIGILTTIDREHLNLYKNLHEVTATFRQFLEKIPFYGKAFVCYDDPQIRSLLPLAGVNIATYGTSPDAEWSYTNAVLEPDKSHYTLLHHGEIQGNITVNMPGKHNILNSIAALAASVEAGISFEIASHALSTFAGVDRRFTLKGTFQGAEVFDDYGHHPTEIECTLAVARKRAKNKVILVFQPHRYSRLTTLWKEFAQMLATSAADNILITDIYSAGEPAISGFTGQKLTELAQSLNPHASLTYVPFEPDFKSLRSQVSSLAQEGDVIVLQGAGTINKIASYLIEN
jgi:UDP-N-acetylmuramate--alanine ligase